MPYLGYEIDGNDLYTTYGIQVEKLSGAFDFLKRKGDVGHNWPDEDGIEAFTDSSDINFEARDIVMHCRLITNSAAMFFFKLNKFKAMLIAPGTRELSVPYAEQTFDVIYMSGSKLNMVTKWDCDKKLGLFYVKFKEPNPVRPI